MCDDGCRPSSSPSIDRPSVLRTQANQNFLELQAQLEGTENRISVERTRFNETVQDYNTYIRQFPNNIYAGFFDFDKRPMFEADEGAENAPKVEF